MDKVGQVLKISCKVPIKGTRKRDNAITGSYSFRKAEHFLEYCDKNIIENHSINNEFYLYFVLDECVIGGLNVQTFEIDEYNS